MNVRSSTPTAAPPQIIPRTPCRPSSAPVEQGADWVELDVHLSADASLVVHHDPLYPDGRSILSTSSKDRPSTVPLLAEALDACEGMGVNIEVKQVGVDLVLAEMVVDLVTGRSPGGVDAAICISSFDEAVLARVRSLEPRIDTAQLLFDQSADPDSVERAAARAPWPSTRGTRSSTQRSSVAATSLGLAVNVWTVDAPERIIELAALGVDGIITNVPGLAIELLS